MSFQGEWGARVEQLACEWRQSLETVAAALADTVNPGHLPSGDAALHAKAQPAAEAFAAWRRDYLGDRDVDPTYRLRQLFRAIECDAHNEYHHVLMQLIAVHARLFDHTNDRALAGEMLNVYRRVAEELGLFHSRRAWIEESNYILQPEKYQEEANKLGIDLTGSTSEGLFHDVVRRQEEWEDPKPAGELPNANDLTPHFDARMRLFGRLRDELLAMLRDEFDEEKEGLPNIYLNPLLPGFSLHLQTSSSNNESHQLSLRIHCRTPSDCYRTLRIVHRIGQLRGPGRPTGFRDFIAMPKANGYRALQTVCYWRAATVPAAPLDPRRLIKFNILTDDMHELNEWGVLAPKALRHDAIRRATEEPTGKQRNHFKTQEEAVAHLRDHDLDSQSNTLYCFTPKGKIIFLDNGSRPLDFAYKLHSQLAAQTARATINDVPVGLDTPLKNGDIVRIISDPLTSSLDFTWISLVSSDRARAFVRKLIRRRSELIHPGYALFKNEIIRLLDVYRHDVKAKRKKFHYEPPTPTTADIDRFIERVTLRKRLPSRNDLYAEIETEHQAVLDQHAKDRPPGSQPRETGKTQSRLAKELAHELVSQFIFPDLKQLNADRKRLHELGRIDLCPSCRPTPFDELRYATRRGQNYDTQTVHADGCSHIPPDASAFDLRQIRGSLPDRWPRFRFDIQTADSPRILAAILNKVYDMPLAYLFRVEALANEEGRAIIELDVGLMQPQLGRDLKTIIESTSEDITVSFHNVPGTQHRGTSAKERATRDLSRQMDNPYTETEVTDSRFVGRDDALRAIHRWLEKPTSPLLLVHGQPRIGKSSLVKMLMEAGHLEQIGLAIKPVYIDFRAPIMTAPRSIATHIAQEVCMTFGEPTPPLDPDDDPFVWLNGLLGRATQRLSGQSRLLLIIDEFDADLENAVRAGIQPQALSSLRGILNMRRDILWLLVVQDIFLVDPDFQVVLSDMPFEVPRLPVRNLTGSHARLLIEKPIKQRNFKFEEPGPEQDDIPAQIVHWTGGNPYFIHIICRKLLERAMHARNYTIGRSYLVMTLNQILSRPEYFSHFTANLTPPAKAHGPRRQIVTYIAHTVRPGRRVWISALLSSLVEEHPPREPLQLSREELDNHIEFLERVGVLDTYQDGEARSVSFPIPLLHHLIRNNW